MAKLIWELCVSSGSLCIKCERHGFLTSMLKLFLHRPIAQTMTLSRKQLSKQRLEENYATVLCCNVQQQKKKRERQRVAQEEEAKFVSKS